VDGFKSGAAKGTKSRLGSIDPYSARLKEEQREERGLGCVCVCGGGGGEEFAYHLIVAKIGGPYANVQLSTSSFPNQSHLMQNLVCAYGYVTRVVTAPNNWLH